MEGSGPFALTYGRQKAAGQVSYGLGGTNAPEIGSQAPKAWLLRHHWHLRSG